jgi:hypothetical protein
LKGEGYNAEALTTEFTGDSLDSDVLDTEDAE